MAKRVFLPVFALFFVFFMADFPEFGEIVVCKIYKILDYGVFVHLVEYNELTGFVHISQVSSSWIKNIRNFVKENQVRAAQVVGVDVEKKQVDLSFNKVSAGTQRAKLEAWKQSKRSQKLLEMIAAKKKSSVDDVIKEVANPLLESFESLFDAFQAILMGKKEALKLVPPDWLSAVKEIVEKNMEIPKRELSGVLSMASFSPTGVEDVKSALSKAELAADEGKVEIFYLGSGKYMLKVVSFDYKIGERVLKKVSDAAVESIKAAKGVASFAKA